jgi:hypothetical protein
VLVQVCEMRATGYARSASEEDGPAAKEWFIVVSDASGYVLKDSGK